MSVRMIAIETRRNVGLWFVPVIAALALLLAYGDGLSWRLLLWPNMSVMIRDTLLFAGPIAAGAATWMAGRERRRGMSDLLATTPRPAFARLTATWAATALWAVLAYILVGIILVVLTLTHAVWGGPTLWPILVGAVAIPACAALGYAAGVWVPSRFTAPLVAIVVFAVPIAVWASVMRLSLAYLSPVATLDTSVFYGVRPDVGPSQLLFLLGLMGLGLGAVALRVRDGQPLAGRGMLLAGLALAVAGVATLLAAAPPNYWTLMQEDASGASTPHYGRLIAYTPVCRSGAVTICVHPAYAPYLKADAVVIDRLIAPLRGIPGAPQRAEQRPDNGWGVYGDVLNIVPDAAPTDPGFYGPAATSLEGYGYGPQTLGPCPGDTTGQTCYEAQDALGIWLVQRAGFTIPLFNIGGAPVRFYFNSNWPVASAAARRFAALGPERQHAWLYAHYVALRQGRVPLKALP